MLGLFVMSVPGLWSIIKRATKSTPKRRVYEVDGPATDGAKQMDDWAKDIARYFIKYNYAIVGTGEVITFEGTYQASVVSMTPATPPAFHRVKRHDPSCRTQGRRDTSPQPQ